MTYSYRIYLFLCLIVLNEIIIYNVLLSVVREVVSRKTFSIAVSAGSARLPAKGGLPGRKISY